MKTKTCKNCQNKVPVTAKYCEKCGGSEFVETAVVVQESKPSLVHSLFYWNYNGQYLLSKSKLAGILTFIFFASACVTSGAPIGVIFIGAILGAIVYLLGYALHNIRSKPSPVQLEYNDYGFVNDLIHILFFWQNKKTGQFVLSKTKIISHLVFLLFAAIATTIPTAINLFVIILFALFFEVPTFLIGYGVHKLTNPYPEGPKKELPKRKEIPKSKPKIPKIRKTPKVSKAPEIIPEYDAYKSQVESLIKEYKVKEINTRHLIEKRFEPPQLTYTRFIGVVDKSTELFNNQSESAVTMIKLASDYSAKIEDEIKSKIDVMKNIIKKLDELTNELVLTMDKDDDDEINNLFDDMNHLIDSVDDYE